MKLDIKILALAIVAAGILGYAYYRTADIIRGPRIFITAPENGAGIFLATTDIIGIVKNSSVFTVNGRMTEVDTTGAFIKTILLAPGYNAIELRAEDKFGRTVVEKREVVRK